ncbi:MAG: hypothetical protein KKD44_27830 [Proteobacteria bacterium]|nr:hypothetical protein [Pseudomonadota bacterium]
MLVGGDIVGIGTSVAGGTSVLSGGGASVWVGSGGTTVHPKHCGSEI